MSSSSSSTLSSSSTSSATSTTYLAHASFTVPDYNISTSHASRLERQFQAEDDLYFSEGKKPKELSSSSTSGTHPPPSSPTGHFATAEAVSRQLSSTSTESCSDRSQGSFKGSRSHKNKRAISKSVGLSADRIIAQSEERFEKIVAAKDTQIETLLQRLKVKNERKDRPMQTDFFYDSGMGKTYPTQFSLHNLTPVKWSYALSGLVLTLKSVDWVADTLGGLTHEEANKQYEASIQDYEHDNQVRLDNEMALRNPNLCEVARSAVWLWQAAAGMFKIAKHQTIEERLLSGVARLTVPNETLNVVVKARLEDQIGQEQRTIEDGSFAAEAKNIIRQLVRTGTHYDECTVWVQGESMHEIKTDQRSAKFTGLDCDYMDAKMQYWTRWTSPIVEIKHQHQVTNTLFRRLECNGYNHQLHFSERVIVSHVLLAHLFETFWKGEWTDAIHKQALDYAATFSAVNIPVALVTVRADTVALFSDLCQRILQDSAHLTSVSSSGLIYKMKNAARLSTIGEDRVIPDGGLSAILLKGSHIVSDFQVPQSLACSLRSGTSQTS